MATGVFGYVRGHGLHGNVDAECALLRDDEFMSTAIFGSETYGHTLTGRIAICKSNATNATVPKGIDPFKHLNAQDLFSEHRSEAECMQKRYVQHSLKLLVNYTERFRVQHDNYRAPTSQNDMALSVATQQQPLILREIR